MLSTTDPDELGLLQPGLAAPAKSGSARSDSPGVPGIGAGPTKLVPGSVTAKALRRVWSGEAVTVIDSPRRGQPSWLST